MSLMQYSGHVFGYHGCSKATARRVLAGEPLKPGNAKFDWLGGGIYFWERAPDRALRWAIKQHGRQHAAVIGAVIQLGMCFDLLDTFYTQVLGDAAHLFVAQATAAKVTIPRNTGAGFNARYFDFAVIEWLMEQAKPTVAYQTIRSVYIEGPPIYEDPTDRGRSMGIYTESHIQIAVRDPACILALFKVRPNGGTTP